MIETLVCHSLQACVQAGFVSCVNDWVVGSATSSNRTEIATLPTPFVAIELEQHPMVGPFFPIPRLPRSSSRRSSASGLGCKHPCSDRSIFQSTGSLNAAGKWRTSGFGWSPGQSLLQQPIAESFPVPSEPELLRMSRSCVWWLPRLSGYDRSRHARTRSARTRSAWTRAARTPCGNQTWLAGKSL